MCTVKAARKPFTKSESVFVLVFVLTFVCVCAGALLSLTYNITKDRIEAAEQAAALNAVKDVLPEYEGEAEKVTLDIEGESTDFFIGRKNGQISGVAVKAQSAGYGGTLMVLVGVDADGNISGMKVLSHQETPGLGAKAALPEFLDQFKGLGLSGDQVFKVKKDGGQIDAVTAATITSRAVAKAASKGLAKIKANSQELQTSAKGKME